MFCRPAGVALFTACAQVASAFLIPDTLPVAETNVDSLSRPESSGATHQLVLLPCSDCLFPATHEKADGIEEEDDDEPVFYIQGGANSVAVNFSISDDGRKLEVEGEPIYPLAFRIEDVFRLSKTHVHQVPSSASVKDIENGDVIATPVEVTAHGVAINKETTVSDTNDVLVPIRFSIFGLNKQPVSLGEVSIHLLKQPSGDLSILHIDAEASPSARIADIFTPSDRFGWDSPPSVEEHLDAPPPHHSGNTGFDPHKECKMLPSSICKLRNMLEAKMMGMRKGGCRGKKGWHGRPLTAHVPGHIRPHFLRPGHDGPPHGHHHGRPHHMRPHSQHRHHHHGKHAYRFMRAFSRGLAAVMIPTMAGVAVGMAVSFIGLLLGRLIGLLWTQFYRGGQRGYARIALDEQSADHVVAEKDIHDYEGRREESADETEALPVYEEAPAYEEAIRKDQQ